MAFRKGSRIGLAALLLTEALGAQKPAGQGGPVFEVVSIHPIPPNAPPVLLAAEFTSIRPRGQFVHPCLTVGLMVAVAYGVNNPSRQLLGLPHWNGERAFAVAAKAAADFPVLPPAENEQQVRLMLRAMLADRFRLQLHTETRKERILNLEAAGSGLKAQEVDAPVPPDKEGLVGLAMGDDGGRMIGKKSTMAGVARALAPLLKATVVDRTGLKGYYDFDLKWTSPDALDGSHSVPGLGAEGIGLLMSVLPSQLGLRLTSATGPVQYWVVDHVELPTEN